MSGFTHFVGLVLPGRLHKRFLLFRDRGDQRYCPCCRGHFRTFWPSGVKNEPDTLCPQCSSLARHRLLWLFFGQRPELFLRPLKLLHVAPEPIFENFFKSRPGVDYLSADLDSPPAMVRMDLTRIEMPDESFDAIVCCHVLEHIPDDAKAMKELRRVLRRGGWAILQTPVETSRAVTYEDPGITSPQDRFVHFGQEDHVRVYGRDYVDRLRAAGFDVAIHRIQEQLGPELTRIFGLDQHEEIYFCTESAP